ncbi:MAG: AraC family transcriptional regulator [Kiritimatiellae bacterium]|nr:AraC family transcriptional regulator [Kiritimatiellia bacterium]
MIRSLPIKAVQDVVNQGGLTHLQYARASRSGIPDNVSIINAPRLLTTLCGSATFQLSGSDGIRTVTLKPGKGLYVPATYWVKAVPSRPYKTLGFIFHPDLTRLYIMESICEQDDWHTTMLAADERTALTGQLSGSLFELLNKPEHDSVSSLRERAAANLLLTECLRLVQTDDIIQAGGKAWQHWQAARHYVDEHLQEPLDRQRIASALRLHPNHLSRLFKSFDNLSFSQYIAQARMNRAELLLADVALNINDVAYLCGFSSPNYFIRLYRRTHGYPPGRHRSSKSFR